jgi:hypothetical protein
LNPRALPAEATFADLVRSASLVDGQNAPEGRCLLGLDAQGFRLAADVGAGMHPIPQPAPELNELLKRSPSVQVLTPWGRYGAFASALSFTSLSAFPPARRAIVLVLTDRGLSVRGTDESTLVLDAKPMSESLKALGSLESSVVFVAAEAHVLTRELYALLQELALLGANTSLAVNLSADTALPSAAPDAAQAPEHCPDGLPETRAMEGDLSRDALLAGIAPLRDRVSECLTQGSAAGAAGGRLVLALRISERGAVDTACIEDHDLADPLIGRCVLSLARALQFEAPAPAGVVDAELPLLLRPNSAPAQAPICAR